ncbi:hypothetical protein [Saccharicrinis fermentans]|uniref:Uncharacterized protein n=1 Tax=Saccharicrinis fermentans DSM 9555 = JCM 21142 TaxID=869213 RepID=W7Y4Y0_9BACT|nr:hypothetical protein [Saccharicrinis fermentans]GAF05995.1 hypothetical protein JCM21142_134762 [Saccharicrinis fermentans DSM 9555 = JCM 21142]
MIDRNELLDQFSAPMGNSENKFIDYAKSNGIVDFKELILEFNTIQSMVYDYIYKFTEPDLQLTGDEIEVICHDFCENKIDWINDKGIKALNSWLIWMCWHEGILKKNE